MATAVSRGGAWACSFSLYYPVPYIFYPPPPKLASTLGEFSSYQLSLIPLYRDTPVPIPGCKACPFHARGVGKAALKTSGFGFGTRVSRNNKLPPNFHSRSLGEVPQPDEEALR